MGYYDFLSIMDDSSHEEYDYLSEWAGRAFDPEHFEIAEGNEPFNGYEPSF